MSPSLFRGPCLGILVLAIGSGASASPPVWGHCGAEDASVSIRGCGRTIEDLPLGRTGDRASASTSASRYHLAGEHAKPPDDFNLPFQLNAMSPSSHDGPAAMYESRRAAKVYTPVSKHTKPEEIYAHV